MNALVTVFDPHLGVRVIAMNHNFCRSFEAE